MLKTLSLALLIATTGAAQAQDLAPGPVTPAELKQNWLGGGDTILPEHIERVAEVMRQDPETKALLERMLALTGAESAGELIAIIGLCDPKSHVDRGGQATFGEIRTLLIPAETEDLASGKLPEEYFKKRIDDFRMGDGSEPTIRLVDYHTDYASIRALSSPQICMTPNLSLADAFETLVHEMVHILDRDFAHETDILSFKDKNDYMHRKIQEKGEEVDAYIAEYRATIRLKKSRDHIYPAIRPMFNDLGEFIGDRAALAGFIVRADDPNTPSDIEGMDYLSGRFRNRKMRNTRTNEVFTENEYTAVFNQQYENAVGAVKKFQGIIDRFEREERVHENNINDFYLRNIEIFESNIEAYVDNIAFYKRAIAAHERNLALARKQENQALEATSLQRMEEARLGLDETLVKLPATRAKLEKTKVELEAAKALRPVYAARKERLGAVLAARKALVQRFEAHLATKID